MRFYPRQYLFIEINNQSRIEDRRSHDRRLLSIFDSLTSMLSFFSSLRPRVSARELETSYHEEHEGHEEAAQIQQIKTAYA